MEGVEPRDFFLLPTIEQNNKHNVKVLGNEKHRSEIFFFPENTMKCNDHLKMTVFYSTWN